MVIPRLGRRRSRGMGSAHPICDRMQVRVRLLLLVRARGGIQCRGGIIRHQCRRDRARACAGLCARFQRGPATANATTTNYRREQCRELRTQSVLLCPDGADRWRRDAPTDKVRFRGLCTRRVLAEHGRGMVEDLELDRGSCRAAFRRDLRPVLFATDDAAGAGTGPWRHKVDRMALECHCAAVPQLSCVLPGCCLPPLSPSLLAPWLNLAQASFGSCAFAGIMR